MNVTRKDLPKSSVELTIEVPVDEVKPYIEEAAKHIAKEVEIKGFRKGKVPYDVLAKHVGEQSIYEEAFNAIVEDTYKKAVKQEKLQIAGRVNIEQEKLAPGNPVVYKATVPLLPSVKLGDYKKLKTRKEAAKVDERKIEKTLDDLRKMRAKEKVVNREAKEGDKAIIDFDVKIDGVSIEGGQGQNSPLNLGSNQFIPGFEEAVVGMKKGEEKDFDATFPKEYHNKEIAGKKAKIHVKLNDVYEVELPEINDEMAKEMNFDSAEHLKKELRANMEREEEQHMQQKFESDMVREVMELSEIEDLPDQLVDEEAQNMLHEMKHDIMQQGLKFEDYLQHIKKTEEELLKEYREPASDRIKAALVMRELSIAEDIKVDMPEVDKEMEEMKKLYEKMPEAAQEIDSPQQRERMMNMMVHRKLFERLEGFTPGSASKKTDEKNEDKATPDEKPGQEETKKKKPEEKDEGKPEDK